MNMQLPVSRIQCEPDRTYNKADDMHLRASIKSRLDKGLKPPAAAGRAEEAGKQSRLRLCGGRRPPPFSGAARLQIHGT